MKIASNQLIVLFHLLLFLATFGCTEENTSTSDVEAQADMATEADASLPLPPSNDEFFGLESILDIEITITENDWNGLRFQTQTQDQLFGGDCLDGPRSNPFAYFNASVVVDGVELSDVGVRKEGFLGNLSYDKPSLELKFDHNNEAQFLGEGLRSMLLKNVRQDPSKLNTCLGYGLFRDAGLPAPRCNFANVKINGFDFGVFVHVESMNDDFLALNFPSREGNLYEGRFSDFRPIWKGSFRTLEEGSNGVEFIAQLTDALAIEGEDYREAVAALVDVDSFLTFWAMEVITGHLFGYSGGRNQFTVYTDGANGAVFMPWGLDVSFNNLDNPFTETEDPQSVLAEGMLANRFFNDEMMRAAYETRLRELLETVWDSEALLTRANAMADLIEPYLLENFRTFYLLDQDRVRGFIQSRKQTILAELDAGPVTWDTPPSEPNICWEELGEIDVRFASPWDSLYVQNPLERSVGDAQFETYDFRGNSVLDTRNAVISGIDRDNMEIPEDQYPARISLLSALVNGRLSIINIYIPAGVYPFVLNGDANLVLDQTLVDIYRFSLSPPNYNEPSDFARMGAGSLQIGRASQMTGEPIEGRLRGKFFSLGGYVSGSGQTD